MVILAGVMNLIEANYKDFVRYAGNIMGKENKEYFLYSSMDIVHDAYLEINKDTSVVKIKSLILKKIKKGGILSCVLSKERFINVQAGEDKMCKKCHNVKPVIGGFYKRIAWDAEIPRIYYESICKTCNVKITNNKTNESVDARAKKLAYISTWQKRQSEQLTDWYIKSLIYNDGKKKGLINSMNDITEEMIRQKRGELLMRRLSKSKSTGN